MDRFEEEETSDNLKTLPSADSSEVCQTQNGVKMDSSRPNSSYESSTTTTRIAKAKTSTKDEIVVQGTSVQCNGNSRIFKTKRRELIKYSFPRYANSSEAAKLRHRNLGLKTHFQSYFQITGNGKKSDNQLRSNNAKNFRKMCENRADQNIKPRNSFHKKIKSIEDVKHLISRNPDEVLLTIIDEKQEFLKLLSSGMDRDLLAYVLIAIGKALSAQMSKHVNILINKVISTSYFINIISKYIASFQIKSCQQFHFDSLIYLTNFLVEFQIGMPSLASDYVITLVPLLNKICQLYHEDIKDNFGATFQALLDIEERNTSFLKRFTPLETKRLSEKEKLQLQEPPENFRTIPALPCKADFDCTSAFIRPNLINGCYQDTEHYLDVQYRLLREDYIKSLRDGVTEFLAIKKSGKSVKTCKTVRVYENVSIISEQVVNSGLIHIAYFNEERFANIDWEHSKRLITGSLLCLSDNNFESMLFATIAERKVEQLIDGKLMLRFEELTNEVLTLNSLRIFTVIETTAYFESYRHNLESLLNLDEQKLSMKRYIVEVCKDVLKPEYLSDDVKFDMRPLFLPLNENSINELGQYNYPLHIKNSPSKNISILNETSWPSAEELNLNLNQYEALKSAVTKEFAIIQGPPDTGKTFIGLRIVQLLLHNIDVWSPIYNPSPILIVCYTNHALDQFLEGILLFNKNIVRIGSRSKSEKLQDYQIQHLVKNLESDKEVPSYLHRGINEKLSKLHRMREYIDLETNRLKTSNTSILSMAMLRKFISNDHYYWLSKQYCREDENPLHIWLEINYNDFEDDADQNLDHCFFTNIYGKELSEIASKKKEKKLPGNLHQLLNGQHCMRIITQHITDIINYCYPLIDNKVDKITNVWKLNPIMRWQLYKYWLKGFITINNDKMYKISETLKRNGYLNETNLKLEERIKSIRDTLVFSKFSILNEYDLKESIPHHQYLSLRKPRRNLSSDQVILYDWLDIGFKNPNNIENRAEVINKLETVACTFKNKCGNYTSKAETTDEVADIEYMEEQRNINFNEFSDVSFNEPITSRTKYYNSVSSKEEFKIQGRKKSFNKYVHDYLTKSKVMSDREEKEIKNIWHLSSHKKWQLYKLWFNRYLESKQNEKYKVLKQFRDTYKELCELRAMVDVKICRQAQIIGLTTTGAAKYKHIIRSVNPKIIIVEEAAEILESHIVSSLAPSTQHVILIGDHEQLRPNPTVHMLAVKYDLNVSLFERMIKNGLEYQQLRIQHRMRPIIAALLVPHIYPQLENHESVGRFENIKGVTNNMFFISHDYHELKENDSKSKVNQHEAKFLIKLCKYFICQGYESFKITILTTYAGQMLELKKLAKLHDVDEGVKITVVDNYQGEENDIILISFVRSNEDGEIGFLKTSNRICVALSRAKKGLYCIGNFKLLAESSKLWENITAFLQEKNLIGASLQLVCQNHPSFNHVVKAKEDFDLVPDGGCNLKCNYRMACGHICPLMCHPYDKEHDKIQCSKPCARKCDAGHECKKKCSEECGACPEPCVKLLPCNHKCINICGESCIELCLERCSFTSIICGHQINNECFLRNDEEFLTNNCFKPCNELLPCKHICKGSCSRCCQGRSHIKCKEKCEKILNCGHKCKNVCSEICVTNCSKIISIKSIVCGHKLKIKCFRSNDKDFLSKNCVVPCNELLSCNHICKGSCSKCLQGKLHTKCKRLCDRISNCGHKCNLLCYEKCEKFYLNSECKVPCLAELPCQHVCKGKCSDCLQGRIHVVCNQLCKRRLVCGHLCKSPCSKNCPPCKSPCENWCAHKKCSKFCYETCVKCHEPCDWICSHKKCNQLCGDFCDRTPCDEPCTKILPCCHPCIGLCGEPCPKLCRICNAQELLQIYPNFEINIEYRFVVLEDCFHIFEINDITSRINEEIKNSSIVKPVFCPKCDTVIRKSHRFGNIIKNSLADIEKTKNEEYESSNVKDQVLSLLRNCNFITKGKTERYLRNIKSVLNSKKERSISELKIISNFIRIIETPELLYKDSTESNLSKTKRTLEKYSSYDSTYIKDYVKLVTPQIASKIRDDYLTALNQQMFEISWEVARVALLNKMIAFLTDRPEIQDSQISKLIQCIMVDSQFRKEHVDLFISTFAHIENELDDERKVSVKPVAISIFSYSGHAIGQFHKCSEGHVYRAKELCDYETYTSHCGICCKD